MFICRVLRPSRVCHLAARSYASKIKYNEDSPNYAILEMLNRNMQDEAEKVDRNPYKIRAFEAALKSIVKLDYPIRSSSDTEHLKGVGAGIARRITEFLLKGSIAESSPSLETSEASSEHLKRRRVKKELMEIPGIGQTKATQLIEAGCTSIHELSDPRFQTLLTKAQRIGADFFTHTQQPVQRHEAEAIAQCIRDNISPKFEVHLAGSYRRGARTSSDIDVILLHPSHVHVPTPTVPPSSTESLIASTSTLVSFPSVSKSKGKGKSQFPNKSPLLSDVVEPLFSCGLLAATVSSGPQKWQGIALLPELADAPSINGEGMRQERLQKIERREGVYRRVDLNMVPMKTRGAAFLALTGDAEFNRHVRLAAVKQGLHLNEYGLWRWCNGASSHGQLSPPVSAQEPPNQVPSDTSHGHWQLLRAETEAEILGTLGIDYIEPTKRNFEYIAARDRSPTKSKKAGRGRSRKRAVDETAA